MAGSSRVRRATYLWHHEIHSRIANEQLIFVLAGFDPVYKRQRVLEETKRVLADLKIRSYSLWELIGEHDLMVQAWLPKEVRPDQFTESLRNSVSAGVGIDTLAMAVNSVVRHWMWQDISLERVETDVHSEDYGHLNEAWVPPARIRQYREAGFIHQVPSRSALKFFIRISTPNRSTNPQIDAQILDVARSLFYEGPASNGVIMRVSGGASYLLTGRLEPKNFEAIAEVVQAKFAQSGVLEMLRCRTVTHLSALYSPLARVEQLLPFSEEDPTQQPSGKEVEQWLRENESDKLEFKASAFTDIDHAVGRKNQPRPQDEQTREIAKAVVGMLNATGGTVVIGVAELDKYPGGELQRTFQDAETIRERLLIGVQSEFRKGGWDAYQRRLAAGLRRIIDGDIDGWVKYHAAVLGDNTLCVIRIRRPSYWYYIKDKDKSGGESRLFYGRMGGETRPLQGRSMDHFKQANPRTTRGEG